jgi:hypothetical protein
MHTRSTRGAPACPPRPPARASLAPRPLTRWAGGREVSSSSLNQEEEAQDARAAASARALQALSNRSGPSTAPSGAMVSARDLFMPLTVRSRGHDPGASPTSPSNRRGLRPASRPSGKALAPKRTALDEGATLAAALTAPGTSRFRQPPLERKPHRLAI